MSTTAVGARWGLLWGVAVRRGAVVSKLGRLADGLGSTQGALPLLAQVVPPDRASLLEGLVPTCCPPAARLPLSAPAVARGVQKVLQDYRNLQDIIAILGMDELSEEVGGGWGKQWQFQQWQILSLLQQGKKTE